MLCYLTCPQLKINSKSIQKQFNQSVPHPARVGRNATQQRRAEMPPSKGGQKCYPARVVPVWLQSRLALFVCLGTEIGTQTSGHRDQGTDIRAQTSEHRHWRADIGAQTSRHRHRPLWPLLLIISAAALAFAFDHIGRVLPEETAILRDVSGLDSLDCT